MANDILFSCPFCGKGMVINSVARSLEVTCPDCGEDVIVPETSQAPDAAQGAPPHLTEAQRIDSLSHALQTAHEDIRRLNTHLTELTRRRKYLESLRADHIRRLERIADELRIMQTGIDRIADILQDSTLEHDAAP